MADQDPPPPDTHPDEPTSISSQDDKLHVKLDQCISILTRDDPSNSSEIIESVQTIANLFDVMVNEHESGSKRWIQLEEDESFCFIESVDLTNKLIKCLSRFHSDRHYAAAINRMSGIQQRAMTILEDEFKLIMDDYQTSNDRDQRNKTKLLSSFPSNIKDASEPELLDQSESQAEKDGFPVNNENTERLLGYSDEMLSNLNKLAKGLIGGGHETECGEIYFFIRRTAMEENLKLLQFEKFSIDEMQKMQWEPIEKEIGSWMKMLKEFCTSLLPSERKLADAIFSNNPTISDRLFADLARIVLLYLWSFAEAVMLTKRSAEKLFKFLEIYETLRDNIPEVDKLIFGEWLHQHKSAAWLISTTLGESIYTVFIELEHSIKSDTTKTPVPGGAVHPLNRYVMNYLKYACEYSETLEQVFKEQKKIIGANSSAGSDYQNSPQPEHNQIKDPDGSRSPFQSQLTKIMDLLDENLESKSRLYKDPSLSLIFLMNNGRYILQKTKGTGDMRSLLGDPWVRKQSSDLRNYHTSYTRETWTKLLLCLNHDGLSVNGKVMKPVLKERFKSFNAMFDEIHKTQTAWVVSDEQMQSELRVSISAIVIPAYRSFMGRFSQVFTPGRQTEKYIKYQPEDIETCIEELFDGSIVQGKKR